MLKCKHVLLVGLLAVAACDFDFDGAGDRGPRAAERDRQAARSAIWNPGPGDPRLDVEPTDVQSFAPGIFAPFTGGGVAGGTARTLVLYDTTNTWGYLGELYGMGAANLASHFGGWTAKAVGSYTCGELANYDALIYMGSTYDEPLPTCLLDNVLATTKQVVWVYDNVWQLAARAGGQTPFIAKYGWYWTGFDTSAFDQVIYKGQALHRYAANASGILGTTVVDRVKANIVANARRSTDTVMIPWAIRSGNFTYVADLPFTYMTEEDRYLVFADLLFDALAPATTERHRAVVRLEDISPVDDPAELIAAADVLASEHVPFGFSVISQYEDPYGYYNGGTGERVRLDQSPELVAAIRYAQDRGGVLLMHGFTHQYKQLYNPYTAVSADDFEFYRVQENLDHTLTYVGPTPTDSVKATTDRINSAKKNFQRAYVAPPLIWEFPHYAATPNAYKAVKAAFGKRWERSLYFPGVISGKATQFGHMFGQLFPYVVRDAYGSTVIPENLGNIEPYPFYQYPTRFPDQIINAARLNLVVRDGVAGFYFHPFFDLGYLRETIVGIKSLGYQFVDPSTL